MKNKIVYLLEDFDGLPAGTPLIKVEKTSAILQAEAMVGISHPSTAYLIPGNTEPFIILDLNGMVGDKHPNDPSITGPFLVIDVRMEVDRLKDGVGYQFSYLKTNQEATLCICIDDRLPKIKQENILKDALKELKTGNTKYVKSPFHPNKGYWVINTFKAVAALTELMKELEFE